jgi:hypothetical protein
MRRRASSLACGRRCKQPGTFSRFWIHAHLVSTCRLLLRRTHGGDMPSSYVMATVSKPPANPRSFPLFLSRPPTRRNNPLLDRATTRSRDMWTSSSMPENYFKCNKTGTRQCGLRIESLAVCNACGHMRFVLHRVGESCQRANRLRERGECSCA